MADENHLFCLDAYSGNYEFGKRSYHRSCPIMSIAVTVIRNTTDAEMQTPPDRRCRKEFACIPLPEKIQDLDALPS